MSSGYVNLFVEELVQIDDNPAFVGFATWCVGVISDDILYAVQVSASPLLADDEAVIVSVNDCALYRQQTNGMPAYGFPTAVNQEPRENPSLGFQLCSELPENIRLAIIRAKEEYSHYIAGVMA